MSLDPVRKMYGANTAFIDNQTATADVSLVAAKAGHRCVVDLLVLSCGTAAGTAFLEKGTSTAVTPTFNLAANSSIVIYDPGIFTGTNQALTFTSVGGGGSTMSCFIRFHFENAVA